MHGRDRVLAIRCQPEPKMLDNLRYEYGLVVDPSTRRAGTRALPHFRVIFVRYGSNLAYVTVLYSDLFYGFGYRLRSYGHGNRSGVRRSQNEGHIDRY